MSVVTALLSEAQGLARRMTEWRRKIHRNPEVGRELPDTTELVRAVLTDLCIPWRACGGGTIAVIGRPDEGRVLLRADMDALPLEERSGLAFASENGASHSCGHDLHTAMLLGAAVLLKRREDDLAREVALVFQPDEEGLTGALSMIEDGLLTPEPDCAFAMHVDPYSLDVGRLLIKRGTLMASCDRFTISVEGRGGHGAHPDKAISPIPAATAIVGAFSDLRGYEISPMSRSVLTIGFIHAGAAHNVIPSVCTFGGTLRMLDDGDREKILRRMEETAQNTARAYRCSASMELEGGAPALRNDDRLVDATYDALREAFGEARILPPREAPSMGSEDFAHVTSRVPSCYMTIGCRPPGTAEPLPLHNPSAVFDEGVLPMGAAVFAIAALGSSL
ncbi:M20 family metallopeptidase [Synergistaceae bacterium OttesenSCG-928-I11]|nr:M20 family metallopeptidase [Synergistaceae bacterium OttesenSCG-928-I11]